MTTLCVIPARKGSKLNVFPGFPISDALYCTSSNSIMQGKGCGAEWASLYKHNIMLRKFGQMLLFPSGLSAIVAGVADIFNVRNILEVVCSAIVRIKINVVDFVTFGTWTKKGFRHDSMDRHGFAFTMTKQLYLRVFSIFASPKYQSCRNSSDETPIGDLIPSFKSRDRLPDFFHKNSPGV